MRLLCVLFFTSSLIFTLPALAQTFNGKNLKWELEGNSDKRIKAFLGSTGYSLGSEGTSVVVENLTENKLFVTFQVSYTDFCGNTVERKVTHNVAPFGKAGTSAWLEGYDYAPKCNEKKKYADNFYSKLSRVKLELVSIKETGNPGSVAQKGMSCEQLINYRDKKLVAIWDKKRAKYQIGASQISTIKKIKKDLLQESQVATSDLNLVLLTLKTASNAVEDIISAASPQGYLMDLAKKSGKVAISRVKLYENIKKGDKVFETVASEDVEKTIAIQALTELGRLGSIVSFIKNVHDNLNSLKDYQEVKQEVNKQMAALDRSLENYNSKLKTSYAQLQELNQYKEFIDEYLKENCSR